MATQVKEKKQALKQDEKAHLAQAKADKLQRQALDNGKTKKAEKAQDKADKETQKAISTSHTSDDDL
jgi:hypothetical protein